MSRISPRSLAAFEEAVVTSLRALRHPTLPTTLGGLNTIVSVSATPVVNSESLVSLKIDLSLLSPAAPSADATRNAASKVAATVAAQVGLSLAGLPHFTNRARPGIAAFGAAGFGLKDVRSAIAVASGKGGVGKSMVAVNLAFALAKRGAKIGLLDGDVHGPSLPTMLTPQGGLGLDGGVVRDVSNGTIGALDVGNGVNAMSYGWVSPRNERGERRGVAMRGPLVASTLSQLTRLTSWGSRDALIIDTPPGTGDVHMTLGQLFPMSGAVIVTTPQALAMVDASKGVDLWAALKVKPLALVLNMAYYPGGKLNTFPFGNGKKRALELMNRHGIPHDRLFEIPIHEIISEAGDTGNPLVMGGGGSGEGGDGGGNDGNANIRYNLCQSFDSLAATIAEETEMALWISEGSPGVDLQMINKGDNNANADTASSVSATWSLERHSIVLRTFSSTGARETLLSPLAVRRSCRCAACIDEHTGVQRLDPKRIPENIIPLSITPVGNYGISIKFSDGHSSGIFTFAQLREIINNTV